MLSDQIRRMRGHRKLFHVALNDRMPSDARAGSDNGMMNWA
jgi:hypothetical protein